ncbi:hypothetical protein PR202_ga16550 [Eleusine coracana subsp. coracana]|uniref:Uncharacterized protein n=1 Tax=Eleusine coracana subsp. coracana TaxID=191504 RepID=A0AAV5CN48_ELECO|nr:hypothetical protein PR202_ga16550 [Eleusine coracana subsp. coracana]
MTGSNTKTRACTAARSGTATTARMMASRRTRAPRGFEPRSRADAEWRNSNFSGGCRRKEPVQCVDGFAEIQNMKLTDWWYTLVPNRSFQVRVRKPEHNQHEKGFHQVFGVGRRADRHAWRRSSGAGTTSVRRCTSGLPAQVSFKCFPKQVPQLSICPMSSVS